MLHCRRRASRGARRDRNPSPANMSRISRRSMPMARRSAPCSASGRPGRFGIPPETVESRARRRSSAPDGGLEHAAAPLHPQLGVPLRKLLGKGAALILVVENAPRPAPLEDPARPQGRRSACAAISTAWRPLSPTRRAPTRSSSPWLWTDPGRPHPRVGGLKKEDVKGENGLTFEVACVSRGRSIPAISTKVTSFSTSRGQVDARSAAGEGWADHPESSRPDLWSDLSPTGEVARRCT